MTTTSNVKNNINMRVAVVSGARRDSTNTNNNNNNNNNHHCSDNEEEDSDAEGAVIGRQENNNNWSHGSPNSMHSNGSAGANPREVSGGGGHMVDQAAMAAAADAEGVWSPDIDQAFQEALAIYPPCGRRKIILSDEGKMYGRNELIARYIKLRTGKTRTRKQVSSHIQVLARKKSREIQAKMKDSSAKEKALNSLTNMSSAQIVSMSALHNKAAMNAAASVGLGAAGMYGTMSSVWNAAGFGGQAALNNSLAAAASELDVKPFNPLAFPLAQRPPVSLAGYSAVSLPLSAHGVVGPAWEGRTICTPKIRLCEFSAYCLPLPKDHTKRHDIVHITSSVTHNDPMLEAIDISQIFDKFPSGNNGLRELYQRGPKHGFFLVKFWADLSFNVLDEQTAVFAVDSRYESEENMTISVSTKVCSFGKQVVEKVEHEYAKFENGRFVYRIQRSPMCEYMNNFIHKLKKLPERYMMNSVLENFTILQLVTSKETQDVLLCIAFVFEVSDGDGSQHRVYRLTYGGGK